MHNHLANFLKATKISGIAHIDLGGRFFVIFGFWLKNQPFLQKMAEFSKTYKGMSMRSVGEKKICYDKASNMK